MKKITALVMAVVLAVSLAACGNTENSSGPQDSRTASQNREQTQAASRSEEGADGAADSGGRILIAYFAVAENSEVDAVASASVMTLDGEAMGITEALANMIADETGGDLFSIQTSTDYPADINDVIDYAAEEQDSNARPALTTHIENLEDYDTVFVGYPNWWYDMPMAMYSFFDEYDFSGKTIIPFNSHNGSRFSDTIDTIQELEPDAAVITDGFTVRFSDAANARGDVSQWLDGLGY